jgi:hypothetical protein
MKRSAPLQRSGELKRSPIRGKRATPRARKPRASCSAAPRCKRQPSVRLGPEERVCKGHATAIADKLVGDYVKARDGWRCQLSDFNASPCWQPEAVYWCHLIPKGRYYATRWEPDNAVAGCAGHHKAFDTAPIEKDAWSERRLGADRWAELRQQAIRQKSTDVAEIIAKFRGLLAEPPGVG